MNIFLTSPDISQCALEHCRVHRIKMILETAQLLCTAHHEAGSNISELYKPTHRNHPSAVWVRESQSNYLKAYELFIALGELHAQHSGKQHKSIVLLSGILSDVPNIPDIGSTPIKLAMPDEYKAYSNSPYECYQAYLNDKLNEWEWYLAHPWIGIHPKPVKWDFIIPDWYRKGKWYIKRNKPKDTL